MSVLLDQFERDCTAIEVAPTAALKRGGVHPSLWWKWKNGDVSPTLRSFEAARAGLEAIRNHGAQDAA